MKNCYFVLFIFLLGCIRENETKKLSIPKIISDNAVFQRNKPISIWGNASPGEKVVVHFHKQTKTTKTDPYGNWLVYLNAELAGGPHSLEVIGERDTILLKNILVGEVWVCSGQSNMEMTVSQSANASIEIQNANFPQIRHVKIPHSISEIPQNDVANAEWEICTPQTVGDFTAVGYYFARGLFDELNVPIGLINCTYAATNIETWISNQTISQLADYQYIRPLNAGEFDQLGRKKNAATYRILKKLGIDEGNAVENIDAWIKPDFDASYWDTICVPSYWENILPGLDGVLFYRKEFYLPTDAVANDLYIHLGKIDDADVTWLNGIQVGQTNGWNIDRLYKVNKNILKAGKNVIVVRVEDVAAPGGIFGPSDSIFIENVNGYKQTLIGAWQYMIGKIYRLYKYDPEDYPSLAFNGMINPLINYKIGGFIWYQGESNAMNAFQYRTTFPAMINDWRFHWKSKDIPFLYVQLPAWEVEDKNTSWAELREAQAMALSLPNTGMAVTIDIGERKDIHPKNKQDVAKRLTANALKIVYGKDIPYSGPVFNKMEMIGNKVFVSFKHAENGLISKNRKSKFLEGFEVAGDDKKFHEANAMIFDNKVVVFSDKVSNPVAVRYAWAGYPGKVGLFNKEGFPAHPFRTDNWEEVTKFNRYRQFLFTEINK